MRLSGKMKIFIMLGFIALTSLLMLKFIFWGKEVFAPYIGA